MSVKDNPAPLAETPESRPLRRNREFQLLWSGAGVSYLGSRVSAIAYSLLIIWTTGSATQAGLVTTAALLPSLVVQLPAGLLVDRWDRRKTMMCCDAGRLLLVGSVGLAVAFHHIWLPQLLAVAFCENSLMVFYRLAERATVAKVVPSGQLGTAMARNEARGQASGLIGQPVGTFLFAAVRWLPFGVTAIAHLASMITLLFIRKDLRVSEQDQTQRIWQRLTEGFSWVWHQKYLRRALGLIAGSNILFQILTLAVIVIIRHEGRSPATVGFIVAANGTGGLAGALTSGMWMRYLSIRRIIMTINVMWAVLMPLIAFVRNPAELAAIYFCMIYAAGVGNVAGLTYQLKITPDGMQGRAGSVASLLASGTNSIGALAAGFMLAAWGAKTTVLLVGAAMLTLALLAVLGFAGPKAKRLEAALGAGVVRSESSRRRRSKANDVVRD
ncbi:MAG: MFS transporter [Streptosporangiaceae bacterium]|nr:MFS transporter [Streptosporangiaceae bacterium]